MVVYDSMNSIVSDGEEVSGVGFGWGHILCKGYWFGILLSIGTLLCGKCMGVANMLLLNPSFGVGYGGID